MSDAEQSPENIDQPDSGQDNSGSEDKQDYKALYEQAQADLQKVAAKKDELYKETKKAKSARDEAAQEAQRIAEETAKKNGEFEKLWKSATEENEQLRQQIQNDKNQTKQEKLNSASMKIATELADGDNAELLSRFVKENLENMAEDDGSLSDDVMQAVSKEFKNSDKFKSLLRSSKASGGGAPGSGQQQADSKSVSQSEFNAMSADQQHNFLLKQGGVVVRD